MDTEEMVLKLIDLAEKHPEEGDFIAQVMTKMKRLDREVGHLRTLRAQQIIASAGAAGRRAK